LKCKTTRAGKPPAAGEDERGRAVFPSGIVRSPPSPPASEPADGRAWREGQGCGLLHRVSVGPAERRRPRPRGALPASAPRSAAGRGPAERRRPRTRRERSAPRAISAGSDQRRGRSAPGAISAEGLPSTVGNCSPSCAALSPGSGPGSKTSLARGPRPPSSTTSSTPSSTPYAADRLTVNGRVKYSNARGRRRPRLPHPARGRRRQERLRRRAGAPARELALRRRREDPRLHRLVAPRQRRREGLHNPVTSPSCRLVAPKRPANVGRRMSCRLSAPEGSRPNCRTRLLDAPARQPATGPPTPETAPPGGGRRPADGTGVGCGNRPYRP